MELATLSARVNEVVAELESLIASLESNGDEFGLIDVRRKMIQSLIGTLALDLSVEERHALLDSEFQLVARLAELEAAPEENELALCDFVYGFSEYHLGPLVMQFMLDSRRETTVE